MDYREIETWRDLRDALATMTEAELDQRAQLFPAGAKLDLVPALQPLFLIGEVRDLTEEVSRSCFDNEDHPRHVVLFSDRNPFDDDGSIGEDLATGERVFPRGGREPAGG